jgi:flavorubredoxin/flavin reductase (DIM6/NTAB) family NADH-FMN oxidoreductase RutF/rubredoxin
MHQERKLETPSGDIYYVGANDRRLSVFEGVYCIPRGVSYNSYLVMDEKTVLLDTVDKACSGTFLESVEAVLAGRKLDYVIINHMEPDHCATLPEIVLRHPEVKIIGNEKTFTFMKNFFDFDIDSHAMVVKEGDTLKTGKHTFTWVLAPMVHWPEVMVTYDLTDKILFSADAFGTFGALAGNIYADEVNFWEDWLPDARRYYCNIVGKYGDMVSMTLEKAATLQINMVCPLHGPIWRKGFNEFFAKYQKWASYEPEDPDGVVIAYASVYGDTANAADILAGKLAERGVKNVTCYDVSMTDSSQIVAEAFRVGTIVFASTTYNAGIFIKMEETISDIVKHALRNRNVAIIENGSWSPASGGLMKTELSKLDNIRFIGDTLTINSSLKEGQQLDLNQLADQIVNTLPRHPLPAHKAGTIDAPAMFKFSYGLFVLFSQDGTKDNGCIINTGMELSETPTTKYVSIAVNHANYTCDIIKKTKVFNLSMLTQDAPFSLFQNFGFHSAKDFDKFAAYPNLPRAHNGLYYIDGCANAFVSCKVIEMKDIGAHTLFIGEVTEAAVLSNEPSLTYAYYMDHIKPPKPAPKKGGKGGERWQCTICGFVYEGHLPEDFVCPMCKHGRDAFERIS